jgi:hypothetical protein
LASLPQSSYYFPVENESSLQKIVQEVVHNICP